MSTPLVGQIPRVETNFCAKAGLVLLCYIDRQISKRKESSSNNLLESWIPWHCQSRRMPPHSAPTSVISVVVTVYSDAPCPTSKSALNGDTPPGRTWQVDRKSGPCRLGYPSVVILLKR